MSRALLAAVGVDTAVGILVDQFGWDAAFSALSRIDGPAGEAALWRAVEALGDGDPGS